MREMSKRNKGFARGVAAASLAVSLAMFACTTDRNPGAGAPLKSSPYAAPSSTPGSESNRPIVQRNPAMSSSMLMPAAAQGVRPVNVDALATLAADQGFRGRVLGYLPTTEPPSGARVAGTDVPTGQFINPSAYANPQSTVNSSISSSPTPVIAGSLGATGVAVVGTTAVGAATNVPMTSSLTNTTSGVTNTSATASAVTVPSVSATQSTTSAAARVPNSLATPTNTAIPVTVGQFAAGPGVSTTVVPSTVNPGSVTITNIPNGSLTPTVSSGAMTTPLLAANAPIASVGSSKTSAATTTSSRTSASVTSAPVSKQLVILRDANGGVTITNIGTSAITANAKTTTTTGKAVVFTPPAQQTTTPKP